MSETIKIFSKLKYSYGFNVMRVSGRLRISVNPGINEFGKDEYSALTKEPMFKAKVSAKEFSIIIPKKENQNDKE